MREGFQHQIRLGCTPISEVKMPVKMRGHLPALLTAMQYIYVHPEWSIEIENLLWEALQKGKKDTGRKGMNLWSIFVLAQVRLGLNISYDELYYKANYDQLLRGVLGVDPTDYSHGIEFSYQQIYDNVTLLDDELLIKLNEVIVNLGHQVFKKKENTALRCKSDSFVVETDTHFPTDYTLLFDSGRKCIDLCVKAGFAHWRKHKYWSRKLKRLVRQLGQISRRGGKQKQERLLAIVTEYLEHARELSQKVSLSLDQANHTDDISLIGLCLELMHYHQMLDKHIDLVERRLVKGEVIAHKEKIFSVFQPYTEWINKGKRRPSVEIGKKLFVTTDQFDLIVDYQIGQKQADNHLTIPIADRLLNKYSIASISFDRGFFDRQDKELLELYIPEVIMPKKGKKNQQEKERESSKKFVQLRNQHAAIESNINELEHRGLDRCPDRNERNFKRYVGIGVVAYNLHKIGRALLKQQMIAIQKEKNRHKRAA